MAGPNVTVEGITPEQLDLSIGEWVKAATIETGEEELRSQVEQGFDNEPVVITDGMPRRDYLQVKPFGTIEFAARPNMAEAVMWALTELQKKSPVLTGRYASTHTVLLNGTEITGNIALSLRNVSSSDHVMIVNPQPYARKLEGANVSGGARGRRKRRASSRQAPNGIYRVVQREVIARYGRTLFVDFKYVPLNLGVKVWGDQGGGRTKVGRKWVERSGRARKRVQRDQVYPCLSFFILQVSGSFLYADER